MENEWQTSVLVPIFKGKRDVRNCNACVKVKLLKDAMKIVGKVLERRFRELLNVDAMRVDLCQAEEQQIYCLL